MGDSVLFQEKTPKGEFIIWKFSDNTLFDKLFQNRLDIMKKCGVAAVAE